MNRPTVTNDKRRRKMMTLLWAAVLTAVTITLIYLEKTAILYILATLGVTVLLFVVAFSKMGPEDAAGGSAAPK